MIKNLLSKYKVVYFLLSVFIIAIMMFMSGCAGSYEPKTKTPQISSPTIIQDGVLKVGVDFENPPFAGETTKSSGIDIDLASVIADELGLNVEFVEYDSTFDNQIKNKKVDIVMGVQQSQSCKGAWKSENYIPTANTLFSLEANAPIPLKNDINKITSVMGSSSAISAQNQFNSTNVKLESSLNKCLEQLKKGEAKYLAADMVVGRYMAKEANISLNTVALISKPSGYCICVADDNTVLQSKINEILNKLINDKVIESIQTKWLSKPVSLDGIQVTPGADKQADISELETGIYGNIDGTAKYS